MSIQHVYPESIKNYHFIFLLQVSQFHEDHLLLDLAQDFRVVALLEDRSLDSTDESYNNGQAFGHIVSLIT